MNETKIKIQPDFLIALSVAIVFIPVPWLLSWLIAAIVHELFHLIALKICGFRITNFRIGVYGAGIEAEIKPGLKLILCAAAGPLAGLVLIPFLRWIPRIALCGIAQSIFNLLPVCPMDGSRLLNEILSLFAGQSAAAKICAFFEQMVICVILCISCYATFRLRLGLLPLLTIFIILIRKKYLANHKPRLYNIPN